jgi:hypothetical protein
MSLTSHYIGEKQPGESLNLTLDFSQYVIGPGTTFTITELIATPTDLTISSTSVVGQTVKLSVSGGTNGLNYRIQATITTDDIPPEILIGDVILKVRNI